MGFQDVKKKKSVGLYGGFFLGGGEGEGAFLCSLLTWGYKLYKNKLQ